MSRLAPEAFYRRNLPHIQPPGATFLVTFRLVGSIPAEVARALWAEAERARAELEREPDSPARAESIYREQRRFLGRWDAVLDSGLGPDWLLDRAVAAVVAENMRHFDGIRYDLLAFCIMSNHVHVVLTPGLKSENEYFALAQILHTMKGFTAGRANRLLGRTGAFWLHESYDHYARDAAELERIVAYVVNNPVKAGLVADWREWEWTYCKDGLWCGRGP